MMCQCRFMNSNKCSTLVGAMDKGGGYACEEAGDIREIILSSLQFCCETDTALKKIVLITKANLICMTVFHILINDNAGFFGD